MILKVVIIPNNFYKMNKAQLQLSTTQSTFYHPHPLNPHTTTSAPASNTMQTHTHNTPPPSHPPPYKANPTNTPHQTQPPPLNHKTPPLFNTNAPPCYPLTLQKLPQPTTQQPPTNRCPRVEVRLGWCSYCVRRLNKGRCCGVLVHSCW